MMAARRAYHDLVRHDVLPHVPRPAGRVLDLGGGIGATALALKDEGAAAHVVLVDQVAQEALGGIDVALACDLAELDKLGGALARHGPFDTALCCDVLEHLIEPWETLELVARHLRPGGTAIVSLPNMAHWSVTAPLVFGDRFDYVAAGIRDRTHLRWFSRTSAIQLVEGAGLSVERVIAQSSRRSERALRTLSLRLLERFVTSQYIIVARKPPGG